MAGTNRMLSYSKGIVEQGSSVQVICLKPTEKEENTIRNPEIKGIIDGIEYEYSTGTTIWPNSGKQRLKKIYYILKGLINGAKLIKFKNKQKKIDSLLLYSNLTLNILFFYFASRLFKIPYIQEKSEYPFILRKKTVRAKLFSKLYLNTIFKVFDGALIETNKLIEYYKPKFKKTAKILRVPMTVEPERFSLIKENPPEKYITYCGNMGKLDGGSILIDAFSIISKKHSNIMLKIIGDTLYNPEYKILLKQVNKLKLNNRILFTGRLSRDEVPKHLCNSTILALASPFSSRSTGSLPSKLGEYLATGNPVVITKVGEIPNYLKDGESAFLAEPDSIKSFAEKLDYALSNPKLAKQVGLNGKDIGLKNFDYRLQSQRIIEFINEFKTN